ncbi:MAG: M81 family metallopeptidase [Bacillota bacterium]|nr:M81 family metallopeptidase [Bacillota bacterium]
MRIAIAGFSDETCTFCTEPTGIERFEPATQRGQAILDANRGIPTYINGYMRVLEATEGAEIVPLVYASKTPGGFQSWLVPECFDKYANEIADRLRAAGKLDGVLLSLHGAMAVSGVPKPEAELVRRARAAVGNIPIMVTLDLHANEDHELTDAADAVFILKTYPHVDSQEIGEIAARCMVETVRGFFRPVQATRKPPIISASIYQASEYPPMKLVYDRCREWERKPGVYCVSVAPGYAYADVPDVGMFVVAVTNGDRELAEAAAQDVADLAWTLREQFAAPLPKPKEGVAQVLDLVARGEKPVVIADGADRIGDSTHVLKELLAQGARNWAIPGIADPAAAKRLETNSKVGDKVTISVGGWYNALSGQPVEITGTIEYIGRPSYVLVGPMRKGARVQDGFVARLNLGDNRHVVVADRMRGANDSSGLTSVGVDIGTLDIIVLKDRVHHRAFWDSVAKVDFRMDAPGIGLADISLLQYENIPAGIYPLGPQWRK